MNLPFSNSQPREPRRSLSAGCGSLDRRAGGAPVCDRLWAFESRKAGFKPALRGHEAFTMIEIALCLAIVGFALVAIIGVLPAGLNVQKENREETIINQDATVWMDALRSGSFAYNELVDYVDRVVVSSQDFDANGNPVGGTTTTIAERNLPSQGTRPVAFGNNGGIIVGLLSTPRIARPTTGGAVYSTNYVYAYVRAFSGSASEKAPQDNADVMDLAFSYRMVVETTPAGIYDPGIIFTNAVDRTFRRNLADVRLLFRWPLKQPFNSTLPLDQPAAGNGRLVFRTQLSGRIADENAPYYFFQPRDYIP